MIEDIKNRLSENKVVRFKVKIIAGSANNIVAGMLGKDTLKIRISAAPEKGKANKELVEFLSDTFSVPRKSITIISGHTSPSKVLEISPA